MKIFSLALLTLLLGALWTGSQGISFRSSHSTCCYKDTFFWQTIPARFIKSYQETPSHCSHRAVRVELSGGKKVCVDPKLSWFQQYRQQKDSAPTSTVELSGGKKVCVDPKLSWFQQYRQQKDSAPTST
ncbi:PREDICTED: C-C motif chemokine 26-like [Chaetura pelagica]|uniref:C-C motif chemokine 26-like n=1 Tax=Chaetura pelagica TaxID=8897 RepID=UPI0005231BE1|nr:PREDICTED: C-C motif chemokine 26-like [Chaetura pelagica]